MVWIRCIRCKKLQYNFIARTSTLIAPVQPVLHQVSYINETLPNAPKYYETHQNMSLGSNGWIGCIRCEKFRRDFVARTLICTSSASLAPSFVRQPNGPKCTQIVQNTPKHQFRVQCGGSIVFVAKNSDATSWHELLH